MRPAFVIVFGLLLASTTSGQGQTEQQKRTMEKYKAMLTKAEKMKASEFSSEFGGTSQFELAVEYLLARRTSVGFVEDKIVSYRSAKDKFFWGYALGIYMRRTQPEDVPDKLLQDYAAWLERDVRRIDEHLRFIETLPEFGKRGAPLFIPILTRLRDNAKTDDFAVKSIDRTILILKAM